eukprot:3578006-Rhodomonas_salina.1
MLCALAVPLAVRGAGRAGVEEQQPRGVGGAGEQRGGAGQGAQQGHAGALRRGHQLQRAGPAAAPARARRRRHGHGRRQVSVTLVCVVCVYVLGRAFASEESVDESHELTCAAQYARDHGFSFPKLPASKLKGMGERRCILPQHSWNAFKTVCELRLSEVGWWQARGRARCLAAKRARRGAGSARAASTRPWSSTSRSSRCATIRTSACSSCACSRRIRWLGDVVGCAVPLVWLCADMML